MYMYNNPNINNNYINRQTQTLCNNNSNLIKKTSVGNDNDSVISVNECIISTERVRLLPSPSFGHSVSAKRLNWWMMRSASNVLSLWTRVRANPDKRSVDADFEGHSQWSLVL